MSGKTYCVYIMSNKHNNVLYTGVTGDLKARIYAHKAKVAAGFTRRYNVDKLLYFEYCNDPAIAIEREKQIKAGPRKRKVELINGMNPEWKDLYDKI